MERLNGKKEFTKTEQRIMDLLSDGYTHHRKEILKLLPDDNASMSMVCDHIGNVRRKLPNGQDIVCRYVRRAIHYQHVRLMGSAAKDAR